MSGIINISGRSNSRLNGRLEVACEPNSRAEAKSQFVDDPVPLVIEVAKMYWMVSSRSVPTWILHCWDREIEFDGGHRGSQGWVVGIN